MERQHSAEYLEYLKSPQWKRLRAALLKQRGPRCERCKRVFLPSKLHIHHLNYDRLGGERMSDLLVVCESCHKGADAERRHEREERLYEARVEGWAEKVYGEYWDEMPYDEICEEFDRWIEARGDRDD